jgi:hypothetical protein
MIRHYFCLHFFLCFLQSFFPFLVSSPVVQALRGLGREKEKDCNAVETEDKLTVIPAWIIWFNAAKRVSIKSYREKRNIVYIQYRLSSFRGDQTCQNLQI